VELTRIVAVRHGETAWNVQTRIQGQLDVGLNATGQRQAQRLAQALADEPFDAVYASDLARAHDTARALAAANGLEPIADRGLRERGFGAFEGLTWQEVQDRHPEQALRWRRREPAFGPPGGETLQAFADRAVAAADAIARRHRGQHIALVTHGGVLDALYRAAARVPLDARRTWQVANAGINRLLHGDEGFALVGWGDVRHLDGLDAEPRDEATA
jgi:probable phosphoglycerate mutase